MDKIEEAKKIQLQRLWCQHCKALQKTNDTVVECWYNPLDHGREKAFCAANVDAIKEICQIIELGDKPLTPSELIWNQPKQPKPDESLKGG